jgi:3-oxoacyl-[acyl-carrier protein] reductase
MELGLVDKHVVITGGTRGIGLACAKEFLAEGCKVTIIGSTGRSVSEACSVLGNPRLLDGRAVNLAQPGELSDLQSLLSEADVLVNNAGAIPGGGLEAVDDNSWRAAWDLKVHGFIGTSRLALPAMLSRGSGVIVNVIGIFGAHPSYDYLCGSAGNAALIAFTNAMGARSALSGVRVLGINPGATRTQRLEQVYRTRARDRFGDEERWTELLQDLPFKRLAEPEEIANLAVFLSSQKASYLSGVVINADGGRIYNN